MQLKTLLLGVVILVLAASNASAMFIPPHPVVTPAPTQAPYTQVGLDFSYSKVPGGIAVSGYQTSGSPVSPFAVWSWQFSNGKQVTGITGQSATKYLQAGTYSISLTMSDWATGMNGYAAKRKAFSI